MKWKTLVLKMPAKNPPWKSFEDVVALLEKSIAPHAEVKRNCHLPDLATGQLRQCDVTIQYADGHHRILAIVEVQKRNRPVKIGEFEGWCEKMVAVGANMLICVSQHRYPHSIVDSVRLRYGPRVRLLQLSQIQEPGATLDTCLAAYVRLHYSTRFPDFEVDAAPDSAKPVTNILMRVNVREKLLFRVSWIEGMLTFEDFATGIMASLPHLLPTRDGVEEHNVFITLREPTDPCIARGPTFC